MFKVPTEVTAGRFHPTKVSMPKATRAWTMTSAQGPRKQSKCCKTYWTSDRDGHMSCCGPWCQSITIHAQVPYAELGLFFDIKNNSMWLKHGTTQWHLDPKVRSVHETEAQWWVPDVEIPRSDYIKVGSSALQKMSSLESKYLLWCTRQLLSTYLWYTATTW